MITVDLQENVAVFGDKPLRLHQVQAKVLHLLVEAHPETVSRETIYDAIWGTNPESSILRFHIMRLREKLNRVEASIVTENKGWRLQHNDPAH